MHRLDPGSLRHAERGDDVSCRQALEQLGPLVAVAGPAMDRLFAPVGDSGYCVVLTDAAGIIVERRGKAGDDAWFKEWDLWTGTDWSEAIEGTNGIGTCLVEQRAVTIDRTQHFFDRNAAMSCIGAPLFDHEGELVGVLDISSCRTDLTDGFLLLLRHSVADAAHQIEAENFARAYAEFRVILGSGKASAGPELFAVDKDDLLIGATRRARKTYGLSSEGFKKLRPIRDVLQGPKFRALQAQRSLEAGAQINSQTPIKVELAISAKGAETKYSTCPIGSPLDGMLRLSTNW